MNEIFLDGLPQALVPGIRSIGTSVSGTQIAVETIEDYQHIPVEMQRGLNGSTIFDSGDNDGYSLCLNAAEDAISRAGITALDVDFIAHVSSRIPNSFLSSEVGRLQHDLGARHAIGISLSGIGCADTSMALKLAWDHLRANHQSRNALVAYGHVRYASSRFRVPVTVNGDGGGAVVIGRGGGNEISVLAIEQFLHGSYWNLFSVSHRQSHCTEYEEICLDKRRYSFELAVESKNIFDALSRKLEGDTGYSIKSVDHVIMQNLSLQAYQFYETAMGIQISPVCYDNLKRYGHLGGADIFFNLRSGLETGIFSRGQTILLMNNSPSAAWSVLCLRV